MQINSLLWKLLKHSLYTSLVTYKCQMQTIVEDTMIAFLDIIHHPNSI
jgi:hypothetical protein